MSLILGALAAYFLVGAIFALAFVGSGVKSIDPVAAMAPLRVRLLFAPGAAALWPMLIRAWLRAGRRGASSRGPSDEPPARKGAL